jgi:molecular chaperone GrpE
MKQENKKTIENDQKEINDLKKKLKECEEKCDEYLKGWQRNRADFINYKKEEEERLKTHSRREKEELMRELATVLDSFDLSILMSKKEAIEKRGVELIRNQLVDVLKRRDFRKIDVSPGDDFDPNIHEAVERVDADMPPGKIVEETEKGYILGSRVLRHSRVKVSKG